MLISISDIACALKKLLLFGTVTPLIVGAKKDLHDALILPYSNTLYNMVLVKGVEQSITIPPAVMRVFIHSNDLQHGTGANATGGGNVYSRVGITTVLAAIPTTTTKVGSKLNARGYVFQAGDVKMSFISDQDTILSLSFYS